MHWRFRAGGVLIGRCGGGGCGEEGGREGYLGSCVQQAVDWELGDWLGWSGRGGGGSWVKPGRGSCV